MSFSNFLNFVTVHSETIIQWTAFACLSLVGIIIGRQIFWKGASGGSFSSEVSSSGPLPSEIQNVLQKILDQTNKLENVSVETIRAGAAPSESVVVELELLKKDLQTREEEISRLQKGLGGPGAGDGQFKEYTGRIKELEAKLEEYSILEDDIADLSLYKEENIRLKTEIEQLKTSGGGANLSQSSASASSSATAPEATSAAPALTLAKPEPALSEAEVSAIATVAADTSDPGDSDPSSMTSIISSLAPSAPAPAAVKPQGGSDSDEDLVAEFAQAMGQPAPTMAEPAKVVLPDTGNPMADFEDTVKIDKGETPKKSSAPKDEGSSDLFGEFSQTDEQEEFSDFDADKMMEEMAALVTAEAGTGGSSLDEGVDAEKMLSEAAQLGKKK